jgi:hypothetical protein
MATLARYHKQRRVTRGSWKPRFTKQRINYRGSTKPTAPTLASISPTTGVHGAANQTVTCTGTGYVSGITKVMVGSLDMATTFVSATSVTFVMPLSSLVAGTQSVNVRNGTLITATPKTYTVT